MFFVSHYLPMTHTMKFARISANLKLSSFLRNHLMTSVPVYEHDIEIKPLPFPNYCTDKREYQNLINNNVFAKGSTEGKIFH